MIKPFDRTRNDSTYLKTQELGHVIEACHVLPKSVSVSCQPPLGDLMEILRFCSLKTKLLNGFASLDLEIKKA